MTIVGILGAYYLDIDPDTEEVSFLTPDSLSFLNDFFQIFGKWVTWLAVASPIGLIICAWWMYDYVKKTKELSELIDTPSRAKFVRNLDEVEYLAWSLPQRYENKVLEKKREFKL